MADIKRMVAALGAVTILAVSAAGLSANKGFEGTVYKAYPDAVYGWQVPTICEGHTGPDVRKGMTATPAQCAAWHKADMAKATAALYRAIPGVAFTQGEVDAYSDFVFNVGDGWLTKGSFYRLIMAGDRKGACKKMAEYGPFIGNIPARRKWEVETCLKDLK